MNFRGQGPFNAPPLRHDFRPCVTSPRRATNGSTAYWQAAPVAAAKGEVIWGWSDGPGLEPAAAAAAAAATNTNNNVSGAAAAEARAGAGVAAGVGPARVSGRELPVPETSNYRRERFCRPSRRRPQHRVPKAQTAGRGSSRRGTGFSQADPSSRAPDLPRPRASFTFRTEAGER
ncbi:hypothetical protein H8959_005245 [Pygathrix nigripes]